MYRNKTATGLLRNTSPGVHPDCDSCRLIKAVVSTAPSGDNKVAKEPFHTVAVDAIPIKPISSRQNTTDFVYVDEATKTVIHDPRKGKHCAADSLKDFLTNHVTSQGFTMKRLQADSEAIFCKSKRYRRLLRDRGIVPTYSSAYCHYQNTLAERSWGEQKAAAATVMKAGHIAGKYWDYVLPAVAATLDLLPLKSTGFTKSSYELRTGHKPDVRHIVPLGAPAYARLYKDEPRWRANTDTLRPKAERGRVIGYPMHEKGSYYVLMNDGRVMSRRDVVVNHDPDLLHPKQRNERHGGTPIVNVRSTSVAKQADAPRARSSRIAAGVQPSLRYFTDQVTEAGQGNRGRVTNIRANVVEPSRGLGRIPLPKIIPDSPTNMMRAIQLPDPLYVKVWKEAAQMEMTAFNEMIIPCTREETLGHKVYRMFDILRYKKDRVLQELIFKLRLVFDGSQQKKGVDYEESYSPTLSIRSLLIIIHISTCRGMKSWQADIGNAYLQAIDERVLFVSLPKYFVGYQYARLTGNVYGKVWAGRLWYFTIHRLLIEGGWTRSTHDICVYTKPSGKDLAILGLIVDDTMIFCNYDAEIKAFLLLLRNRFPKVTDCAPNVFAGLEFAPYKEWTTVSQHEYIAKLLMKHPVRIDKRVVVPMTSDMYDRLQSEPRPDEYRGNHFVQSGELRWMDKSRFDLSFALSQVSQFQNNSRPVDQEAMDRIYQYIHNTSNYKLRLGGKDHAIRLFFFVDASKRVESSMLCQMMFLGRDAGCVDFKCQKSKFVALSSTDPEMRSILSATKDAMWGRGFLAELGAKQVAPTPIYTDSDPCILAVKSISHSSGTRYMIPVIAFIRQEVEAGTISLHKVKGTHNPADMGTKALPRAAMATYTKYALHGLGMRQYNGHDDFVKVEQY